MHFLCPPCVTYPDHLIPLDLVILIIFGEDSRYEVPHYIQWSWYLLCIMSKYYQHPVSRQPQSAFFCWD
jgi:hypothetical protein